MVSLSTYYYRLHLGYSQEDARNMPAMKPTEISKNNMKYNYPEEITTKKQRDLEYLIMENKYGNYISYSKLEQIADRHRININKEFKNERN